VSHAGLVLLRELADREPRSDDACGNSRCAHPACWMEEAHVIELTGYADAPPLSGVITMAARSAALRVSGTSASSSSRSHALAMSTLNAQ